MKKIVFFDLDGTLVDSLPDITGALNYALEKSGYKTLSADEVMNMVGNGIRDLIKSALDFVETKKIVTTELLNMVYDYFMECYQEKYFEEAFVYPGVLDTLKKIKTRKVVLTNKPEEITRKLLKKSGILDHIDRFISPETYGTKKPDPNGLLMELSALSLKPRDALLVGDSIVDIETGKRAGVETIVVSYGYADKESLNSGDHVIDAFNELINFDI